MTNILVRHFAILCITALTACGGSGSNPVTGGNSDDGVVDTPGDDPSTTDASFLFNTSKNLVANSFVFNPGDTPGTGTISINNLPFDGVSSEGGAYTPTPGVTLPNGTLYQNNPQFNPTLGRIEDQYYAVVLTSDDDLGTLVGTVATNVYADATQSFGGAYASRTNRGLPPSQAATYAYTGEYVGLRIIRQAAQTGQPRDPQFNAVQVTTGNAILQVDIQDLDGGGSMRGDIVGRQLFDTNGNLLGNLGGIQLVISGFDPDTLTTTNGLAVTQNTNRSIAQDGEWTGLIAGPNGEEVAGYILLEGPISDIDPSYVDAENSLSFPVTGRETGGFIASR